MKKVLDWVKGHIVIVISCVVIVVVLPVAYVISSGMLRSFQEEQQNTISQAQRRLAGLEVSYTLPAAGPGVEAVTVQALPNERRTAWFREALRERMADVAAVTEQGIEFNRKGYEPLVGGLFPAPASDVDRQVRPYDLLRLLVGSGGADGRPSLYITMLEEARAGMPPAPERVAEALRRERSEFLADIEREGGGGQLTVEDRRRLEQRLRDARIARYAQTARRLSFYAEPDLLLRAARAAGLPSSASMQTPPRPAVLFGYQFDFWVLSEITAAITRINTSETGRRLSIDESPIKRIVSIQLEPLPVNQPQRERGGFGLEEPGETTGVQLQEVNGVVQRDPDATNTLTGRASNPRYDIRPVTISMVVDSSRIPEIIEGFRRRNFMAVSDLQLSSVDVWEDLNQGFYYGPGHVIRATMTIETAWLRAWTRGLMPSDFKRLMGIQDGEG